MCGWHYTSTSTEEYSRLRASASLHVKTSVWTLCILLSVTPSLPCLNCHMTISVITQTYCCHVCCKLGTSSLLVSFVLTLLCVCYMKRLCMSYQEEGMYVLCMRPTWRVVCISMCVLCSGCGRVYIHIDTTLQVPPSGRTLI